MGVLLPAIIAVGCASNSEERDPLAPDYSGERTPWTLLVFTSHDCPPCRQLEKETLQYPAVVAALGDVDIQTVDVDTELGRSMARRFVAPGAPNLVFLRGDQPEARMIGFVPPSTFLEEWERIRACGPGTISHFRSDVARFPGKEALVRGNLAVHLGLLGDDAGIRDQIEALERLPQGRSSDAYRDARRALHSLQVWRLNDEAAEASERGRSLDPDRIEALLADLEEPDLIARVTMLLAGQLATIADRTANPQEKRALLERWARAVRQALGAMKRPLDSQVVGWASFQANLAWNNRSTLGPDAREVAREIARELVELDPESESYCLLLARGEWLTGDYDEGERIARELVERTGNEEARALLADTRP